MEAKTYKYGPFDRRSRYITASVFVAVAAIFGAAIYFGDSGYLPAWFITVSSAVAALCILSIPRKIVLTPKAIEIHCILELTTVPLRDLKRIRKVSRTRFKYLFPVLGSFGFFGYYGYYFNLRRWELVKIYARQWSDFVEIEDIYEDIYIVSCPDADEFIQAVRDQNRECCD